MASDRSTGYGIQLFGTDTFRMTKRNNGGTVIASDSTLSFNTNVWYRVEIDFGASDISATLYDDTGTVLSDISATDSDFDKDGITWAVNDQSGGTAYSVFDSAQLL